MIHFVPTVVFDFPFTVNKLPLEVDLVRALLPQIHLEPSSPSRVERRSCHCQLHPSARCREVDPIVALVVTVEEDQTV
jgi:hypothetical protein